jgi:hypothetical protein
MFAKDSILQKKGYSIEHYSEDKRCSIASYEPEYKGVLAKIRV